MNMENIILLRQFVDAINMSDVDRIYHLMADDHLFIDAHGNQVEGRENMKQSWIGYFEMFPDYKIEVNDILQKDSLLCILGYAGGTYKNLKNKENSNYWRVPAAWAVVIEEDRVKKWQVYADNIFPVEIYNRNEKEPWEVLK
jgi:ketosteroid isomerase-like protein